MLPRFHAVAFAPIWDMCDGSLGNVRACSTPSAAIVCCNELNIFFEKTNERGVHVFEKESFGYASHFMFLLHLKLIYFIICFSPNSLVNMQW